MICKICQSQSDVFQKAVILNKYTIAYYKCGRCGFMQTEDPFWIDEVYQDPINGLDTGMLARNLHLSKVLTTVIYFLFDKNADFLDYAGGYGVMTRLMRDNGFNFYWSDAYTKNLLARGFEYSKHNGDIALITSFESFEHFVNPLQEIQKMLAISKSIIFSTEILPVPSPMLNEWWYYALSGGQHVSFYALSTLEFIAHKFALNFYTNGTNIHLFTDKKINPYLFNFLIRFGSFPLSFYVKRVMKSKTFSDYLTLRK